ncbi:hypothetical protein H0H81_005998 [Sphagnurus paluster]|uniref:Uncharacterized protein n=1 Tax=Sphagnurus paluster TaxID=117069 RepID=A0A9P7FYA3_9AGAR|nr:hypothetical protein H0H81_005998 [Sphagnurus paluster]
MTFKNSLHIASNDIVLKLIIPGPALSLTKRLRDVKVAFDELEKYMLEMIEARQSYEKVERHDLFSRLLDANDPHSGDAKLTTSELIGMVLSDTS